MSQECLRNSVITLMQDITKANQCQIVSAGPFSSNELKAVTSIGSHMELQLARPGLASFCLSVEKIGYFHV
jgi:hypothetical protein